jgi:hypothetical protein
MLSHDASSLQRQMPADAMVFAKCETLFPKRPAKRKALELADAQRT